MFMKKASIISLLASLFFSCHADTDRVLEPVDFQQAIQNDSTAIIIDVRTADEFKEGHLHGAMSLDYLDSKTFKKGIQHLDKTHTYYIYCRSGRRSQSAVREMEAIGLHVIDMKGGIIQWKACRLPLEQPE